MNRRDALKKAFKNDFNDLSYLPYIVADFVEAVNKNPTMDFVEDVYGKEAKKARTQPARAGKKTRAINQQVGVSKRKLWTDPKVGKQAKEIQAKLKTQGESLFEVGTPETVTVQQEPYSFEQIQAEIAAASQTAQPLQPLRQGSDIPMTPVESSWVKGAGVYKNHLLIQFHHTPEIFGYALTTEKAGQFWRDLMNSESKGGWVWDELLRRPSEAGMAKGKFFAYQGNNNEWNYYTTPGAQFFHKLGRPGKFTYNPVGFNQGLDEAEYDQTAEVWRQMKTLGYEEGLPSGSTQKWEGLGSSREAWSMPRVDFVRVEREDDVYKHDFVFDSVGICNDCKKEKELYYQKLCNKCYQKRVKNYVDKYDFNLNDRIVLECIK